MQLVEDQETGDRFLVYADGTGITAEIQFSGARLWMTQAQIASLFAKDVSTISRHIASILEDGELDDSNLQKVQIATSAKPVTLYSLDMVISVGYRASSKQATLFRKWATEKLVQFATKGFVIDAPRMKNPEYRDRIAELKLIIRDIRSDEANVYRELRRICALCQDYDGQSDEWRTFYRNTQAKLIYAVCSQTPAEVIGGRADATQPHMGLRSWSHENIRKDDVTVSKNYLGEAEVLELNRLTTIMLDIFEDQSELGRLTLMAEATTILDSQLAALGRSVLRGGGNVSATDAKQTAERAYDGFSAERKRLRQAEADEAIAQLKNELKQLPRKPVP